MLKADFLQHFLGRSVHFIGSTTKFPIAEMMLNDTKSLCFKFHEATGNV